MPKISMMEVIENKAIAKDIFQLQLQHEKGLDSSMVPGKFMHVKIPKRPDLLLRRPFGINNYNNKTGVLSLVYQIVGQGTEELMQCKEGDTLDILGPLGNGFTIKEEDKTIFLVGGGLGVAPLQYVPDFYPQKVYHSFLGFQSVLHGYQIDYFKTTCSSSILCTDDGSLGTQGFVTEQLIMALQETTPDLILCCGPTPMLKALQQALRPYADIAVQVSLEERMGCGVGACAVCSCGVAREGTRENLRVCYDGPVFNLHEVIFDD